MAEQTTDTRRKRDKRFNTIKELVPKSIDKTLEELRCKKYDGNITYLSELTKTELTESEFWKLIINELSVYCEKLARELFPERQDIQLSDALKRCMEECALLDIMKGIVVFEGNKKERLLLKDTVVNNVDLQTAINETIGTKLNIIKWKETGDRNKVYMNYGQMIQKKAMKSGKEFVKLLKVHKIRKHKEKKQKMLELEKEKMKNKREETEEAAEAVIVKKETTTENEQSDAIEEKKVSETENDKKVEKEQTTLEEGTSLPEDITNNVEITDIAQKKENAEIGKKLNEEMVSPPSNDVDTNKDVKMDEITQKEESGEIEKKLNEDMVSAVSAPAKNEKEQIEENENQKGYKQSTEKVTLGTDEANKDSPLSKYKNHAMLLAFLVIILGVICKQLL